MQLSITSEYEKLEAVLVHRPGLEIQRLTHENMRRFLFEDTPFLKRMQEEHDAFVAILREHSVDVVYVEDLLTDVLGDESVRRRLIENVCQNAAVPAIADDLINLKRWDIPALVELLFAGLTTHEYMDGTGGHASSQAEGDTFLLSPIPNAYFSRDPAVTIRDMVISSKMHYRERVRETLILRAVLEHHPSLRDHKIVYGGSDALSEDRPYTIEGGDVLVLSSEAVLVGCSERTRSETIQRLAGNCFARNRIKRVYEIPIPSERAFMHLDTVFTVVDHAKVLWHAPVMEHMDQLHRYEAGSGEALPQRLAENRSLLEVLRDEFGKDITLIDTAGGVTPFAAKEQRMDGANLLAIAPGVGMTYARNERTIEALERAGVTVLAIDGAELVRGLGGPRCMTMPLRRAANSSGK